MTMRQWWHNIVPTNHTWKMLYRYMARLMTITLLPKSRYKRSWTWQAMRVRCNLDRSDQRDIKNTKVCKNLTSNNLMSHWAFSSNRQLVAHLPLLTELQAELTGWNNINCAILILRIRTSKNEKVKIQTIIHFPLFNNLGVITAINTRPWRYVR